MYFVIELRAKNDSNGNPRRGALVFKNGELIEVYDIGYGNLPREYRKGTNVDITTTPVEFKRWLQYGKANGKLRYGN